MRLPLSLLHRLQLSKVLTNVACTAYPYHKNAGYGLLETIQLCPFGSTYPTTEQIPKSKIGCPSGTPDPVRIVGLEPTRRWHRNLNPTRLPIPSYPHMNRQWGVHCRLFDYFANSIALVSRMTLTLIWPGYSSSASIFLAMSRARRIILSSVTSSGLTIMRTSRPAWMA